MTVNISNVGLGDILTAPSLGKGKVIACTEKPSVRVDFDKAGKRWITQHSAELLKVEVA